MKNLVKGLTNRWRSDSRGNVAIIFALSVIPILSIVGVAIDTQMTLTQKNKVQAVVDSAVIFGARAMQEGASRAEVAKDVNSYVKALLKQQSSSLDCAGIALEYEDDSQDINASIFCSQPTTLSNLFGQRTMDFRVASGSTYGIGKVEVAFVFDVSGSMGNSGKMSDLKVAALEAVDTLLPASYNSSKSDDIRLAMTSYDTMVNAGGYFKARTKRHVSRSHRQYPSQKWSTIRASRNALAPTPSQMRIRARAHGSKRLRHTMTSPETVGPRKDAMISARFR